MVTKERSMEEAQLGHTQGQVSSGTCDAVSWGARGQEAAVRGRVNAKQKRLSLAGESSQVWRGRAWAENGEAGASQREGRGCHPSVCVCGGGRQESSYWRKHHLGCKCPENRKNKQKKPQRNTRLYREESTWAEKKNGRETWAPKGKPRSWVPPKRDTV